MKFAFIRAAKANFPVSALCRNLRVTRQGYYAFEKRPQSARIADDALLQQRVREAHERSGRRYGSPRVREVLRRDGHNVGKRRVERAMRSMGLFAREKRRYRVTTAADPKHDKAPNTLDRVFEADKPNQRWVTDITYVWTDESWCYLSIIIDLFSRRVVGWALDVSLSTTLPLAALDRALQRRGPVDGLLHHSDRGCQARFKESSQHSVLVG
jgi:transposase InsO family protein